MPSRRIPPFPTPTFFATPADFHDWLQRNHETAAEVYVGYYKKGTGKPSITRPQSIDEALCFGWIDSIARSLGAQAYAVRFTPRRPKSVWSAINVARVAALKKRGKMRPAGLRAFAARTPAGTGVYSFERDAPAKLTAEEERRLRASRAAKAFFDAQAPWYRGASVHWIVSAKRPETRRRRMDQLIRDCAAGRRIAPLAPARRSGRPRRARPGR